MPQTTKARLIKKEIQGTNTAAFTFQMNTIADWKVGQFAMISIEDGKSPTIKRAYSIASSPSQSPNITFLIKKVENGRGTSWLFDALQEGDATDILLPFGHMILKEESSNEILLIGTGIGIAPMFGFVDFFAENGFPQRTRFIYGVRHEDELCTIEKLEALAKKHPNFSLHITVSRPSELWTGSIGRSDALIDTLGIDFGKQDAYICGSPEVAKSLQTLLTQKGTLQENIQMEAF